ncbi:ABC transporter ATP-binding protein [Enterococcus montenegrensis]|uniref:ABC transporter ATP-binding protein n=1 Tax=Enterococcus montenegrensis TaxID=3031993 RepID=UPI00249E9FAD|nr:ABC transporter ATP-binding protein [Enterococcus montenegrensis]WHA08928.1 ABC transporter ATP-binding protein [Enterococcus montenegrensis]
MTILSFEAVNLIRKQKVLLNNINWRIENGEDWAILGLNGAGKTLLLQMIAGNIWPSNGKLTVLESEFGKANIPNLTKRIGWVSNVVEAKLYQSDTALSIVISGKFASIGLWQEHNLADEEKAAALLTTLGGGQLLQKTYQILSQGEKQVVLIARALMADPELLILDEPCNGLDLFAREDLLAKITKLKQQKNAPTILFVTHHTEEILPFISQVLMIRNGQIYAKGTPAELITAPVLNDFYERPIQITTLNQDRLLVYPKS